MGDDAIKRRKADHLRVVAHDDVLHSGGTLLDCVQLIPNALPELALGDIDTSCEFFGKSLRLPLMVTSMTGGEDRGAELNRALAGVAAAAGIAFAVGSQRVMLRHPERAADFAVRDAIPDGVLLANIGGQQLREYSIADIAGLVDSIQADGICVHLNPAHELAQPEGDRDFSGIERALGELCAALPGRVLVKEVGHGISPGVAKLLHAAGAAYIDVAGSGGTSWSKVEARRAGDGPDSRIGELFGNWGIPTAAAIIGARKGVPDATLIASGGIASGLDIARAVAAGADLAGMAREVLLSYERGGARCVIEFIDGIAHELRCAMLLCGCRDLGSLREARRVYTGMLSEWLAGL